MNKYIYKVFILKKIMIQYGEEYFFNNMYFFLKKNVDDIDVYYSAGRNLSESRRNEDTISIPTSSEKLLNLIFEKFQKSKKRFSKKQIQKILSKIKTDKSGEIDELVDFDGSLSNSKIPIHDPKMSPRKTMDQTVFSVAQPGNPVMRGYRVYWGESVQREEDMSKAFGWEETKDLSPKETIDTLKDMGVENPEERTLEQGKVPKLNRKKRRGSFIRMIVKERKNKMKDVVEDILAKRHSDGGIKNKEIEVSEVLKKNIKSLVKMAKQENLEMSDIIKMVKNSENE
jgi:hypothetical protein